MLSRQIELLQANADRFDSVLMYASDHGESLGEQGIYLHGMPYAFAPRVQKEVPMLFWASRGYVERTGLSMSCVRARMRTMRSATTTSTTRCSGALAVRDAVYDPALDLLARLPRRAGPAIRQQAPCRIAIDFVANRRLK